MFRRAATRVHRNSSSGNNGIIRDVLGSSSSRSSFHRWNNQQHADVFTRTRKGPATGRIHEGAAMPLSGAPLNKEETLLKSSIGFGRILTLNNPRNFNRLDIDIAKELSHQMKILNTAPFVKAIVLQSSGAEAFCYGHNMQAVRRALIENNDRQYVAKQFREASKLAYYIATCETPVVTILNGSVFGSGAGVGCFADFVISNPGTKYATPEVSYGYMPDSGNVFLLKKIDQKFPGVGMFMGLTGAQIKGFDLIQCDVSTHIGMPGTASLIMEKFTGDYEKSQTRGKLHDAVMHAVENDKIVSSEPLSFGQDLPSIKRCFHNKQTVEDIVTELNALADSTPDGINITAIEWAKRTLAAMNRVSPLALKVTHRAIHRAITEDLSLHACHNMEFRAGQHLVNSEDFKIGVDALVSGEGMPENWPSGTIESIDNASIDPFFNEPLTLEDHGTCDLELPMEVFMEDQLLMRLEKRGAKN